MQIKNTQIKHVARAILLEKLSKAMSDRFAEFKDSSYSERTEFLNECYDAAISRQLITEQGIASYALAAWYLGLGFEKASIPLLDLLQTEVPEVRRVYAMNEWVSTTIGTPDQPKLANEALMQAFYRTHVWSS